MAIAKAMRNYCGAIRNEELLAEGLSLLESYEQEIVPALSCSNPHDLTRTHEVLDILTVSRIILEACRMRKSGAKALYFERTDYPEMDPPEWDKYVTIRKTEDGETVAGELPLQWYLKEPYAPTYAENYDKYCAL